MNGYECITGAIDFFEDKLYAALRRPYSSEGCRKLEIRSTAGLAAKSGYSVWHFTRLFACITGTNPGEYITGRIMSECACCIASQKTQDDSRTLASVAFAAGFDDYETFSRSFRRRFGLSPRTLKAAGTLDSVASLMTTRFVPDTQARCTAPGRLSQSDSDWFSSAGLKAEIVDRPPFHITGLPFYLTEKTTSFNRMWSAFSKKAHLVAGRTAPETFCQYTAWTPPAGCAAGGTAQETEAENDGAILVLCALVTDPVFVQEPVFTNRAVPGGKFLHCIHSGGIETISETYRRIYSGFIAASELPLTSCWEYQTYNSDGSTSIYIPLSS
ncbi:MAG: helix-turn-helix domain-containing protein [Treponema sp.]